MRERKTALRRQMKARRAALTPAQRAEASARVTAHLLGSALWRSARSVGLYHAMPREVDTRALLQAAWAQGKTPALPVTPPRGQPLVFRAVAEETPLQAGPFGILEPRPEAPLVEVARMDLLLLPGLAFDRRGARLGYGGGYYDRSLAPGPAAVMLAFSCQELERVPEGPWDQRVRAVVTEDGWRWAEG